MGEADKGRDAGRLARDLFQRLRSRAQEARPQQQVLRRVAGDGELRHEEQVGARPAGLADRVHDPLAIAVEVADGGVELGEREPHARF
jgi:hypothetical protein